MPWRLWEAAEARTRSWLDDKVPGERRGSEVTRLPAAFLGHGNPMNALDHNRYTEAWRAFGPTLPRPRAILVVSAHWYINASPR